MHAELSAYGSILVLLASMLASACTEEEATRTSSFTERFEQVGTVILEEPDSAPLTGIRDFTPTGDGRFVVVDEGRPQVRLYAEDGRLLNTVGRFGDGPGEFRRPLAARMDSAGRLYVADGENNLITRFTPKLSYDTAFAPPGMLVYQLDIVQRTGSLFAVLWNEPTPPHDFLAALLTPDGALTTGLHPIDSLIWSVPYWTAFAAPLGAAGSRRIVTGDALFYPLHLYDASGKWVRDFGTPPPSWRPPGHPELGDFMGVDGFTRLKRWAEAMTTISSVGIYQDSAIVVVHAQPRPRAVDIHASTDTLLDIYSMDGTKMWQDVPVPGRVLRVEDFLYVLEAEPPDPWTVGIFRAREPAGGE